MHYTSRETYEFIAQQTNDPIVEWKTCRVSGQPFPITQKDLEFYEKVSPMFNGVKYSIPAPTLCPEERQRRRLAFRLERKLYKRPSDLSGKMMVTMYSPDKPYKVYAQEEWRGDGRDAMEYGRGYDPNVSFFQQFLALYQVVPTIWLGNIGGENAEYNNNCYNLKNSYMNFTTDYGEAVFYNYVGIHCKNVMDCSYTYHSENCYQCLDVRNGYACFFSTALDHCSSCYFSADLMGCNFCFGCSGLRNMSYVRYNQAKTKEERQELFKQYWTSARVQTNLQDYYRLLSTLSQKYLTLSTTEDCIGDYCSNSKNLLFCFNVDGGEDLKYVTNGYFCVKDVQDSNSLWGVELGYECNEWGMDIQHCCFVKNSIEGLFKSFYCVMCGKGSANLFGCVGLRGKQYCILNKQYTKEEYEGLVPQIIEKMEADGEWWEFFPIAFSHFGYNETVAQDYFPLNREEALQRGYQWSDYESPLPQAEKMVEADSLPADISLVSDDILKWAIICEVSGRPFMLVRPELEFYRKHGLSLPRKHPDVRCNERMSIRHPREFHKRACSICGKEMVSVFAAADARKILCEGCYQQEMYG